MYKHIAISAFLLFLSTVVNCQQAGFIVTYYFANQDECNSTSTSAEAKAVGVCFDESGTIGDSTSVKFSVSSNPTSFNTTTYSTKDCSGAGRVSTTNFSECLYNFQKYEFSATPPALSGLVGAKASSCTAVPTSYTYSLSLDYCQNNFGRPGSSVISYAGGDACFFAEFAEANCTGAVTSGAQYGEEACHADSQGGTFTTSGCQIDGKFLPPSTLKPTAGSVFATTDYPTAADCSGPSGDVNYNAVYKCDGNGNAVVVDQQQHVIYTSYDNYNCTGNIIYSAIVENLTTCDADAVGGGSSKSIVSSFPSSYSNVYAVVTTDSCTNPTVTYSAETTPVGCVPLNKTSATITGCSPSGNQLLLTQTTYSNLQCSGTGVLTENLTSPVCFPADDKFIKIVCPSSSTSSPTSAPSPTTATAVPTRAPTSSPTTGTAAPTTGPTAAPTSRATTTGNSTTSGKSTTSGTTTNKPTTTNSASFVGSSVVCVAAVLAAMMM